MPYKPFKRGGKYKVYKIDADGKPTGSALGTHDSRDKALAQIAAIEANTQESSKNVRTSDLHELVTLHEAELDQSNYAVKVRLIQSGWSQNGRYYPDEALQAAANLWEGVKAYADHPSRSETKDRPERSVRDIVGLYENVKHDGKATRADFKVLGSAREWLWPLIEESVSTGRDLIGLSINALGQTVKGEAEGRKGIVVEAITHANSVDVVTEPAAGGGFEQLMMSDDGWTSAVLASMSIDELKEARPDVIESLKNEWKTVRDSEALVEEKTRADRAEAKAAALEKDKRTLKAQLSKVQEDQALLQKERTVDSLLQGATLPAEWLEDLRAELMESDPNQWNTIIEAELRKAKAIKPKTRVTGAGRPAGPEAARLRAADQNTQVRFNIDESAPQPGESFSAWKRRTKNE